MNNSIAAWVLALGIASSIAIKATGHDRLSGSVEELGPIKVGAVAPDMTVNGLDGAPFSLSSFRGKGTLLEFGATWCGPCRASLRPLRELAEQSFSKAVAVASIHVSEDRADVQQHYSARNYGKITVLVDEAGNSTRVFGVRAFPTLVLLDAEGIVRMIQVGAVNDMATVRRRIEAMVEP